MQKDPLAKREQFAVALRKVKKRELIRLKRMKIGRACEKAHDEITTEY